MLLCFVVHLEVNIFSCTELSSSLFTSERPYFVEMMEPVVVSVDDPLTLKCCIAGTPDISVCWFKADGKLRNSNTCSMDFSDGLATLKLMKTTKSDDGKYVCKAENRAGSASSSCNVTVKGDSCCDHASHSFMRIFKVFFNKKILNILSRKMQLVEEIFALMCLVHFTFNNSFPTSALLLPEPACFIRQLEDFHSLYIHW